MENSKGVKTMFLSKFKISSDEEFKLNQLDKNDLKKQDRRKLERKQLSLSCLKSLHSDKNVTSLENSPNKDHTKKGKKHPEPISKSMTLFHRDSLTDHRPGKCTSSLETMIGSDVQKNDLNHFKQFSFDNGTNVNKVEIVTSTDNEKESPAAKCDELLLSVTPENPDGASNAAKDSQNPEELDGKKIKKKRKWTRMDHFMSCVLVGPLAISSWHGLWGLMDLYPTIFPHIPTAICGVLLHTCFALLRGRFQKCVGNDHAEDSSLLQRGFSRIYCWFFMASCVSHWRGGWAAWPGARREGLISLARMSACLIALIVMRSIRNLITVPFYIQLDSPARTYYFHTRFRKSNREPLLYFLDCMFSVVVTGSLVVFVWRGVWDLLDVYLFPEDRPWSAWVSFMIGYGLTAITFLLQGAANRACTILKGVQRLLVADLFLLLSFLATINVWWSIWRLLEVYFLPDNQELSYWITHCACFLLLMLLNCSNSVLVRGVYIDAEEEGGQCVIFPCYYLRLFFQKEKVKKRQKRLEAAAMEKGDGEIPVVQPHFSKSASSPHSVTVKTALLPTAKNHIVVHLPSQTEIPDNIKHEIENNKCKIVDQLSKVP